jgi:hypothetical protein
LGIQLNGREIILPLSMLLAGAMIAGAILFTFRYSISPGTADDPPVRLDHWTGVAESCTPTVHKLADANIAPWLDQQTRIVVVYDCQ